MKEKNMMEEVPELAYKCSWQLSPGDMEINAKPSFQAACIVAAPHLELVMECMVSRTARAAKQRHLKSQRK